MQRRFEDPAPSFLCCSSMDLLRDFYVQQTDGSNPQLSDINKFDLLVFTLDNREKNDQLKTCVAQVVYNRICIKKPTWIYINRPALSQCTYEFSTDLEGYLENNFSKVHLVGDNGANEETVKIRNDASAFVPGTVPEPDPAAVPEEEQPAKKHHRKNNKHAQNFSR
jgi:hypothetical protein